LTHSNQFGLLVVYNSAFSSLSQITLEKNKKLYAQRHQYQIFEKTTWTSHFDRIHAVLDVFDNNHSLEWLWYTDTDVLITNFRTLIQDKISSTHDFIISTDTNGINTGSVLFKNTKQCKALLQELLKVETEAKQHWDSEQWAINNLLGFPGTHHPNYPSGTDLKICKDWENVIQVVPQRTLNSYDYNLYPYVPKPALDKLLSDGSWQPGDWVIHFPGVSENQKISLCNSWQSQILL
jgi:hypothetical protein